MRHQAAEAVCLSGGGFALPDLQVTPVFSLSLWERVGVRAPGRRGRMCVGWRLRLTRPTGHSGFLPLPVGEGWGEGTRPQRSYVCRVAASPYPTYKPSGPVGRVSASATRLFYSGTMPSFVRSQRGAFSVSLYNPTKPCNKSPATLSSLFGSE